jgi:leucine dehydrogenase
MRRIAFSEQRPVDCRIQIFRSPARGIERACAVVTTGEQEFGLGGTRCSRWASDALMLEDCVLLAQGMKYKSLFHRLPYAGAKVCIELTPNADENEAFTALGEFVAHSWDNLITTEDIGTSPTHAAIMHRVAPGRILGRPVDDGGSGDPSAYTARGVWESIKATAKIHLGRADGNVAGLRVFVKGVGHVGAEVARLAHEEGAIVIVSDINDKALERFRDKPGVRIVPPAEADAVEADVFSPCAKGGEVGETFAMKGVRAIVGAANNQLVSDEIANLLHRRGICYVPDWAANGGGLISVAAEHMQKSRDWAWQKARGIGARIEELLVEARERDLPPLQVAYEQCERTAVGA